MAEAAAADPHLHVFADELYADWLLAKDPALAGRVAYDIRFELLDPTQLEALYASRKETGPDWQRATAGYGLLVLDPVSDAGAIRIVLGEPWEARCCSVTATSRSFTAAPRAGA